ncbi:hypothetical protein C2W59_00330 [Bacillus pumilus]|uniref:Uncharacterized protein n=1 Tax=Bacillus pumilus TaxID=1408 RepID=A0AB34QXC9_BACPU|nr:hypothetical protein BAT_1521 [Bacillus pumilus ATCC 7061]KIL20666.1 hypothetical protein B4127_2950 [Bacillus pumilus]RAP14317.1 hypothetical protein C2W58_02416 [Bacillus pumilus]RAP25368.1 hypothetical protein C2W59_00330 [Bacillus pumilus]
MNIWEESFVVSFIRKWYVLYNPLLYRMLGFFIIRFSAA